VLERPTASIRRFVHFAPHFDIASIRFPAMLSDYASYFNCFSKFVFYGRVNESSVSSQNSVLIGLLNVFVDVVSCVLVQAI
jgi:hypothetical protein